MSNSTCPIRTDRFLRILFALGTSQARHTVRKTSVLGLFLGASHIHYAYVRLHDDIRRARITIRGCAPGVPTATQFLLIEWPDDEKPGVRWPQGQELRKQQIRPSIPTIAIRIQSLRDQACLQVP